MTAEIYRMLNDAVARITDGVPAGDVETFYGVLARFGKNLEAMNRGEDGVDGLSRGGCREGGAPCDGGSRE